MLTNFSTFMCGKKANEYLAGDEFAIVTGSNFPPYIPPNLKANAKPHHEYHDPNVFRTSKLPLDVLLMLTDLLNHDRTTSISCSEVCRGWNIAFRPHIFKSLKIRGWSTDFADFCSFVMGTPGVCAIVTELHLYGRCANRWHTTDTRAKLTQSTLSTIVHNLPNLSALKLTGIDWVSNSSYLDSCPSGIRSTTVVQLHVDDVRVHQFSRDILPILCLFSNIRVLVVDSSFSYSVLADDFVADTRVRGILQNLRLQHVQVESTHIMLNNLIANSWSTETLRSIDISTVSIVDHLKSLLGLVKDNLTHLGFGLNVALRDGSVIHDPVQEWRYLSLGSCTSLQSLTLDVVMAAASGYAHHWPSVVVILSQLPKTIQTITIRIRTTQNGAPPAFTQLTEIAWHRMEKILCTLPKLETCSFLAKLDSHSGSQVRRLGKERAEYIKDSLRLLDAKGILKV